MGIPANDFLPRFAVKYFPIKKALEMKAMTENARYAINVPNFGDYSHPNTLTEFASDAEKAGWDGFFIWVTFHARAHQENHHHT